MPLQLIYRVGNKNKYEQVETKKPPPMRRAVSCLGINLRYYGAGAGAGAGAGVAAVMLFFVMEAAAAVFVTVVE
jgi:hypothetical protein